VRFTLVAARKDLRRLLADPLALVLWLGIPLLLGGLLSLVAGRQAPAPRVHLLVADRDDSFLSNALTSSSRWGDLLELERVGLEAGRARLDEGEASALLLIPAGFQDAVLGVEATRLGLWTNPAQRILPRIIQEGLEILIEVVHYAQLLFGDALAEARTVARGGELVSAEGLARVAPLLGAPLERGRNLLAAPPLSVRTAAPETEPARPPTGFGMLFLPGILFMSLVFVAQGLSDDLWRERELGTFRRFLAAPHGLAPVLGGKLPSVLSPDLPWL